MSGITPPSSSPPSRSKRKLLLINGPNLNLLGTREPHIYGSTTLSDVVSTIVSRGRELNIEVVPFQSNHEGLIVDFIQSHFTPPPTVSVSVSVSVPVPAQTSPSTSASTSTSIPRSTNNDSTNTPPTTGDERTTRLAAIVNPAAFTHTSVAIRDALLATSLPFVEVHVSNIHAREPWRAHSYFSDKAVGVLMGLGVFGYTAALEFWAQRWDREDADERGG